MSIGSVIVTPTPTAAPLIAPMTGLVQSKMRRLTMPPPSRGTPGGGLDVAAAPGEGLTATAEIGAGAERPPRSR